MGVKRGIVPYLNDNVFVGIKGKVRSGIDGKLVGARIQADEYVAAILIGRGLALRAGSLAGQRYLRPSDRLPLLVEDGSGKRSSVLCCGVSRPAKNKNDEQHPHAHTLPASHRGLRIKFPNQPLPLAAAVVPPCLTGE